MSLAWVAVGVIGVAAVCVGLLWLARRSPFSERFAREVREHDEAFKFLGVGYAVLLAFVVISAYTSYNDAKSGAEAEAEAILQLSRTAEAFSPEQLERLEGVGGAARVVPARRRTPGGEPSVGAHREVQPAGRGRHGAPPVAARMAASTSDTSADQGRCASSAVPPRR